MAFYASAKPMAIFSRAQLKYGSERDDFIHRWYERPLHQDTSFKVADDGHFLNPASWLKTAEAVRLGKMNGLAVCLTQSRRDDVISRSVIPGGEMDILVELPYQFGDEAAMAKCFETAEMALKMPNSYRLDGKIVLTRYPACRETELWFYTKVRTELKEKYGDRFLVIPYFGIWEKKDVDPHKLTQADIDSAKERLRRILRGTDGFVLTLDRSYYNRRFDPVRFQKCEQEITAAVMNEPEFRGRKRLGVLTRTGHENSYRWQYTHDSQGTEMICSTISAAMSLGADFVFCPEWDEENENTHFRPTVCNGFSAARILRYFANKSSGRKLDTFPGDDASIPNLILSYRKSLVAGEPIEVEVRNVPDGTFKGVEFSVGFAWIGRDGKVVKKFPAQTLKADELDNIWFNAKVTDFISDHRTLLPFLSVRWKGGKYAIGEGFWPIDLNPLRNIDHKWVKQPLRELMRGVTGKLEIGAPDETGMRIVRGKVKSAAPIRTIEVVDNVDTAYVYTKETAKPAGYEQFRIQYKGHADNRNRLMNGTIRVVGCSMKRSGGPFADKHYGRYVTFKNNAWIFKKIPFSNWGGTLLFSVPSAEIAKGKVVIDLEGSIRGEVALKDLMTLDEFGFNTTDSCGIVVSRSPVTEFLPSAFNGAEAEFSFKWKPIEKASVLRLQVVGMDYRLWRGKPESVYSPSGERVAVHVFERDEEAVTKTFFDANMFEKVKADFSGRRGSVMYLGSGRALAAMRGSSASLSQGYGQGESHYGNPLARYLKVGMAKADGWWVLPMQVAPGFAGFRLEIDIKPNRFGKLQGLYGAGNCGLTLQIEPDGTLLALPAQGNAYNFGRGPTQARLRGPKLREGEWNRVVFATDRKTMWFEVDGVKGAEKPYSDYFWNQRYGMLGAIHPTMDFFDGEIRSFKVEPL
jgi:hypothetical protein